MAIFKGAGVAIVTPMFENGEVNYDTLGELLDNQIENSTDAIIICGTTGEAATLSHEEHLDVIKYAVDKVAKRVPVIAGTGSNCTETAIYLSQEAEKMLVRLHTGDPSIYGAIREQMDQLNELGIPYAVCPGVSSFCGAAAALGMEYTLPDITQSVVITRMAGRTPVPERESIASFASHGATMVVFLSTGMLKKLSEELMKGGYKATWPDEKVVRCMVATLAASAEREQITKTALIIVGDAVAQTGYERSKLYDPGFTTEFRQASVKEEK